MKKLAIGLARFALEFAASLLGTLVVYSAIVITFALSLTGSILIVRVIPLGAGPANLIVDDPYWQLGIGLRMLGIGYGLGEALVLLIPDKESRASARSLIRKCLRWFASGTAFLAFVALAAIA